MSRRPGSRGALLALLALLWPAAAGGWSSLGPKWSVERMPVEYLVGPACEEMGDEDTLVAAFAALEEWEEVECAHVSFEYVGRAVDHGLVDGGLGFLGDGFNNLSWCLECADTPGAGRDVLGFAMLSTPDGVVLDECDVFVDDSNEWTIDEAAPEREGHSARAVALHEIGHCVGLGHSEDPNATMFASYTRRQWILDGDDIEALCTLYPLEDGCLDHEDCDEGSTCFEGTCLPLPTPPRDPGDPCTEADECESGVCVLDPVTGESLCSVPCDLADPRCPGVLFCRRFGPCEEAFCVPSTPGDGNLGSPCSDDVGCASRLCDEGTCALPCDANVLDDECPAETFCWATVDGCGACRTGDAPARVGEPCEQDAECGSGRCGGLHERYCTKTCETPSDCPDGARCEDATCFREGDGTLGSPCRDNDDCALSACAFVGEDGVCSQLCDGDAACPEGFVCEDIDGTGVCSREGERFGEPCEAHSDCRGELCAGQGDDTFCTRSCDHVACPSGWECLEEGGRRVCAPRSDAGGCGCRAPASQSHESNAPIAPMVLLIAVALLPWKRCRR